MSAEERVPFAVMAKPIGSLCNMRCSYCYYLGNDDLNKRSEPLRMTPEVLERFIRQYIEGSTGNVVPFTWHGGEPTLAGLDFFRQVVDLQKKYLPAGWECWNNIQTNGLLLDEQWCDFLAEHHFDVGLSIDGSRLVHDTYRLDTQGNPTYERVAAAAKRLMDRGIQPDLLCTVTSDSAKDPLCVYRGLRDLHTGWMQFIPIVRWAEDGSVTPDSITPDGYGRFLRDIFAYWILNDLGRTQVQLFAEMMGVLAGRPPGLCWMAPECGRVLIVEKDGSVYSCDHFVDHDHLLGSIFDHTLSQFAVCPEQIRFGKSKRENLTTQCKECQWLPMCGGGCPKDRFSSSKDGESGQYFLCSGLETFFSYSVPKLKELMEMRKSGRTTKEIQDEFRRQERERWAHVGRNDLCPCGSGKKAKNCCWNRRP